MSDKISGEPQVGSPLDCSRPPIEVVAWVFRHVAEHMRVGGSYRYLIYDRMGYGPEAYQPLYEAGGQAISNAFCELAEFKHANATDEALGKQQGD